MTKGNYEEGFGKEKISSRKNEREAVADNRISENETELVADDCLMQDKKEKPSIESFGEERQPQTNLFDEEEFSPEKVLSSINEKEAAADDPQLENEREAVADDCSMGEEEKQFPMESFDDE